MLHIQGCMRMPALSVDAAEKMIQTAVELGVNFFDNATCYTAGEAETRFGDAFRQSGIRREDVIIQSKCGLCFERNEFDWTKEKSAPCMSIWHKSMPAAPTEWIEWFGKRQTQKASMKN
ncbi:MAG: aldo/keto reductase [Clostridia bacterium]|nr:aldo/keto reductase [Clostridia bacterium]